MDAPEENNLCEVVNQIFPGLNLKRSHVTALSYLINKEKTDLIINLPVGYGKSLIYQAFPYLYRCILGEKAVSLVITPLNIIQNEQLLSLKGR